MTIAERINAERVVLAGWSRAILLQLAHPLVAQGVADHSSFSRKQGGTSRTNVERRTLNAEGGASPNVERRTLNAAGGSLSNAERRPPNAEGGASPNVQRRTSNAGGERATNAERATTMTAVRGGTLFSAAARLHHTVQAMRHLTFGDPSQSRAALEGIRAIHRRVNGTLVDAVGPYPAGTPYSAEDASLVLWVHATLLDSLPRVYEAVVRPISATERDEWCRESAPVARALGGGADVPETWADVQTYMSEMLTSGRIVVSDTARDLAADVLAPRFSALIAPWRAMNRTVTVGLLPPELRVQYGFPWSAKDDATLVRTLRGLGTLRRLTPDVLALWPDARQRLTPDA